MMQVCLGWLEAFPAEPGSDKEDILMGRSAKELISTQFLGREWALRKFVTQAKS